MADVSKLPIRSFNLTTAFNGAKASVELPEFCNEVEVIATGVDVYVALRDTATATADDGKTTVNLDTDPDQKACLVVASVTVPMNLKAPGGKKAVHQGPARAYPHATRRARGFLHYKPTGASGTGRLIINCYK